MGRTALLLAPVSVQYLVLTRAMLVLKPGASGQPLSLWLMNIVTINTRDTIDRQEKTGLV